MVRLDAALQAGGHRAVMLLQVHDELVFECPPEELEELAPLVKREMEGACHLDVPLLVDIGIGANWRDAK
jgi:DNA polymerase-1